MNPRRKNKLLPFNQISQNIFVVLCFLVHPPASEAVFPIHEKRDRPRFLATDGVPFVPEEFRDYNNIIFNRIDFPELKQMSQERVDILESMLLDMIKNETETSSTSAPEEKFVQTRVKYVGRGLWTNKGRNAKLAVSLDGFVCEAGDAKCHTKRCHLELNETFLPPPWPEGEDIDSRRQSLDIVRWSCARKERWCYVCRQKNSDALLAHANGNDDVDHSSDPSSWPICQEEDTNLENESLFKLNCNRQYGDLSRSKRYGCSVKFTQVAGQPTEIQSRSCTVVDEDEDSDEFGNCQSDAVQYRSTCICHKSGCNGNDFVRKKIQTFDEGKTVDNDVRLSVLQLRSDIERMMHRYILSQHDQYQNRNRHQHGLMNN